MSKTRNDWYKFAEIQIKKYPKELQEDQTFQSLIWLLGIENALLKTEKWKDGKQRVSAAKLRFKENKSICEISKELQISESTCKKWIGDFVNLCGRQTGY